MGSQNAELAGIGTHEKVQLAPLLQPHPPDLLPGSALSLSGKTCV